MVEWGDLNFGEGGIGSGHGDSLMPHQIARLESKYPMR